MEVVLIYVETKINTFGFVGSAAQALEYIDLLAATCFEENVEIFPPADKSDIKPVRVAQKDKDALQKETVECANSEMKKKSHIEKVLYLIS